MAHKVVVGTRHPKSRVHHDYSTVVSRAALAAGLVYFAAVVFDLYLLWFGQGTVGGQRVFVALTGTIEGLPKMLVATALAYLGFYVGDETGPITYRILAAWLLVLGLGALFALVLLGMNYAYMAESIAYERPTFFRLSMIKAVVMSTICVLSLLPLGALGFQTRKR